jgi:DNA-binding CsgD family transcriptional regulator
MSNARNFEYPKNLIYDVLGEEIELPDDYIATVEYVLLTALSERQRKMLPMYYRDGKTLQEIGKCYCLTRERVRQIIEKSIQKLRVGRHREFLKYGVLGTITRLKARVGGPQAETDTPTYKDIRNLGLSARSRNSLWQAGIFSVGSILKLTPFELARVRNLGSKSYAEIVTVLESEGYDVDRFKVFN